MSETKTDVKIPVGWLRLDRDLGTLPGDWYWSSKKQRWRIVCRFTPVLGDSIVIRRCRYTVGETVYVWKSSGFDPELDLGTAVIARVFASDHRGVQQVALKKTGNPRIDSILTACASDILAPVFPIMSGLGSVPQEWDESAIAPFGNDPNEAMQTETVVDVPDLSTMGVEIVSEIEPPVVKTVAEEPQPDHIADADKMVGNSSETPNGSQDDRPQSASQLTIQPPLPKPKSLYIAGPMRGIAYFNYPMFDQIAGILRDQGLHVISPADEDRKQDGFDPFENPEYANPDRCVFPSELDFHRTVRRCLDAVMQCEEIVLLPGWECSSGAVAELTLAMWLGKRVRHVRIDTDNHVSFVCFWKSLWSLANDLCEEYLPETNEPGDLVGIDDDEEADDILEEALNITRGSRNASYGPPDQDFRRTAGMWSALFAAKLREGETFEPRDVALAMILLKTSRETHQRKRDNWVDIAGYARCGSLCN